MATAPTARAVLVASRRKGLGQALALALRQKGYVAQHVELRADALSAVTGTARPDIVLIDGHGDGDVEAFATAVRNHDPDARLVVLGADSAGDRPGGRPAGAELLGLHVGLNDLADIIEERRSASAVGARRPPTAFPDRSDVRRPDPTDQLTAREREVLCELIAGSTSTAMAEHLRISRHTVRTHLQNIFGKLGVHKRLEAVAVGLQAGLRGTRVPDTGREA